MDHRESGLGADVSGKIAVRQMAMSCLCLHLPVAEVEPHRPVWMPGSYPCRLNLRDSRLMEPFYRSCFYAVCGHLPE